MSDAAKCASCGADVPAGAPAGACPHCALARTREEFERAGLDGLYAALVPFVVGSGSPDAAAVGASLAVAEGAVHVAVRRLRARHRASVRAEIRDTVADDGFVDDDEIRRLMQAVAV